MPSLRPAGRPPFRPLARLRNILGPDASAVRQTLGALVAAVAGAVVAGLTLGSITGTLEALPGLLVLVPAAANLRGAIFGTLGSRLGTAMHTGQFQLTRRLDTVVGQNLVAVAVLTLGGSLALAVMAKAVVVVFDLENTISVADYVVISVAAGVMSAVVMTVFTFVIATGATRLGWDLDNVTAPLVTAVGDMVTIPLLWAATPLARVGIVTPAVAALFTAGGLAAVIYVRRTALPIARRIVTESLPVIMGASLISLIAGLTIEKRFDRFDGLPALLAFVPPFLSSGGALGGILSSRVASKLHLGLIVAEATPPREARRDIGQTYALAVPLFVFAALAVDRVAALTGLASPGPVDMVGVALLGALLAVTFAVAVAYYGSVLAFRLGLDPDNYGIPLVTSSMDFIGAFSLIVAVATLGVA